jgi:hypothetical protein
MGFVQNLLKTLERIHTHVVVDIILSFWHRPMCFFIGYERFQG